MKIDCHQHFWKYTREEYGWMGEEMRRVRRDFLPTHLQREISAVGIDGVVAVQARQSLVETNWLLDLAAGNPFIKGVVGWVPLISADLDRELGQLSPDDRLRGVRHVLQDETDDDYMLRGDFNRGINALESFGLIYDILIFERHLPQAIRFVDRHPRQIFVLDHIAKPRISEGLISPWKSNLEELSKREHVYCKISGMVTEADWETWSEQDLRVYLDVVLEAFGPERLMFGSDWPLCSLACDYGTWFGLVSSFIAPLSPSEQERILGGTAVEVYRL